MSFYQRLRLLLDQLELTNKKLSELTGISEKTFSEWKGKKVDFLPRKSNLKKISAATNCSLIWLTTGKGNMLPGNDKSNITATISPGDINKFYNPQEINKQPVYKDGSLRLLVMWMNDYFEKYPHQVVGFVEDLRKIYPSFDAFVEHQGGPDRGEIKKDVI